MNFSFSNEMKLMLLTCLNNNLQENMIEQIMEEGIDWKVFYKGVKKHKVYPVVYRNLCKIGNISSNKLTYIEKLFQTNKLNSLKLVGELVRLTKLFDHNDIKSLSIKGPALASYIYNNISMRASRDLDILICKEDIEKTDKLLLSEGYTRVGYEDMLTPKQKEYILKTYHHFSYFHSSGIILEIHWRFYTWRNCFSFDDLWKNRSSILISDYPINILNHYENLLYLIYHGSKHGFHRLRWLCDIVEIVNREEIELDKLIQLARDKDMQDLIVQTFLLIQYFFDLDLPNEIKLISSDSKLGSKLANLALPIILDIEDRERHSHRRQYAILKRYNYAWNKRWNEKSRFVLSHLYPSTYYFNIVKLNDNFFFLYFVLSPFIKLYRLIKK